jgi:hypothetical protein
MRRGTGGRIETECPPSIRTESDIRPRDLPARPLQAQVLMSTLIAQRSVRDPADFEIRVIVMIVVTAALEAMREWLLRDGKGSFIALVNQALDVVDAGVRLDEIASPPRLG